MSSQNYTTNKLKDIFLMDWYVVTLSILFIVDESLLNVKGYKTEKILEI